MQVMWARLHCPMR